MITISHNLARQVRAIFRRALKITSRGLTHPVTLQTGPDGLSVRACAYDVAIEYLALGE